MNPTPADRFLRWFYDDASRRTPLWYGLFDAVREHDEAASMVDQLVSQLVRRVESGSSDLFPLPPRGAPLHEGRDYDDVFRYCLAAVLNIRNTSIREGIKQPETVDVEDFDAWVGAAGGTLAWSHRLFASDPTAGPALMIVANERSWLAWGATLTLVRKRLAGDLALATEEDQPVFADFLSRLIETVDESRGDWQSVLELPIGRTLLDDALAGALKGLPDLEHQRRQFRTRFHHAFWRTCGQLLVEAGKPLSLPQDMESLSRYEGIDIFAFMREQHQGMMHNTPHPFRPRRDLGRLTVPALIAVGREIWWDNLVRQTSPGAGIFPPPTAYSLEEGREHHG